MVLDVRHAPNTSNLTAVRDRFRVAAKASGRKVLDGNLTMALRMPQGIGGGVQYGKGGKKGAAPVSGAAAKNMPAKQLPSTMAELAPDNENVPVDG